MLRSPASLQHYLLILKWYLGKEQRAAKSNQVSKQCMCHDLGSLNLLCVSILVYWNILFDSVFVSCFYVFMIFLPWCIEPYSLVCVALDFNSFLGILSSYPSLFSWFMCLFSQLVISLPVLFCESLCFAFFSFSSLSHLLWLSSAVSHSAQLSQLPVFVHLAIVFLIPGMCLLVVFSLQRSLFGLIVYIVGFCKQENDKCLTLRSSLAAWESAFGSFTQHATINNNLYL